LRRLTFHNRDLLDGDWQSRLRSAAGL
jgi:hypothetical protein